MSESGTPTGLNSSMLASIQQHGGNVSHDNLGSGSSISSNGVFGSILDDTIKMIGEGENAVDGMFNTGSPFQEMISKFNPIEDNIFSTFDMLDRKGPFPTLMRKAPNYFKFVGSTRLANLSFGPQLNMKGGVSAVSIKGRENQG
jgi:hypothetical protein